LRPILPRLAKQAAHFLMVPPPSFSDANTALGEGAQIGEYQHLMQRVTEKQLDALFGKNETPAPVAEKAPKEKGQKKPAAPAASDDGAISFKDFEKIDLRAARIVECRRVEGSNKLLLLTLDAGDKDANGAPRLRQVFSGIAASYAPETLTGKLCVLLANIPPKKMGTFGMSEGMVLSASGADDVPYLLQVPEGAQPGMRIS
ncbi:MAG: methionine--tRNA ligase, partial [Ottowia sp.]|nr:methionine--tRNA ligase [Ottowia sp.]